MASDTVWTCAACQLFFSDAEFTEKHWANHHQKAVKAEPDGETVIVGDLPSVKAMLSDFLPAYKKQVEQEFAETICKLLELSADAKDDQTRRAEGMPTIVKLNAAAETLRSFRATVRVMADLPLET